MMGGGWMFGMHLTGTSLAGGADFCDRAVVVLLARGEAG
jgi:hypothetical protein